MRLRNRQITRVIYSCRKISDNGHSMYAVRKLSILTLDTVIYTHINIYYVGPVFPNSQWPVLEAFYSRKLRP